MTFGAVALGFLNSAFGNWDAEARMWLNVVEVKCGSNAMRAYRAKARQFAVDALNGSRFFWKFVRGRRLEDLWWALRAPHVSAAHKIAKSNEVNFYSQLFEDFNVRSVFDIGANCGDKTEIFLASGADQVLLVEPDPYWTRVHKWRFEHDERVKLCHCAVSRNAGTAVFHRFAPGSPLNTLENGWVEALTAGNDRQERQVLRDLAEVETVSVAELVERYGQPNYIKVDVEGHEASVLAGMRRMPRVLSLEFNLPEFGAELIESFRTIIGSNQRCEMNFVTEYARGFELGEWVEPSAMKATIDARNLRYFELFISCDQNPSETM